MVINIHMPANMPSLEKIIHENLSMILTFSYSYGPLHKMLEQKVLGDVIYLRKTIDLGISNATRAAMELAIAFRLLNERQGLFIEQLETLNKYRGKGQQKVTVEHVHVHEGGQAIVGAVTQQRGGPHGKA